MVKLKDIIGSSFHDLHALYKGEADHVLIEINSDWLNNLN